MAISANGLIWFSRFNWINGLIKADRLVRKLQAGFAAIKDKDRVKSDPRLPFGETKKSGVGRELSHCALTEFANIKSVVIKEM